LGGILFPVLLCGFTGVGFQGASKSVDRKSMGHTVGERWWNNMVFLLFSVTVIESVLRLAVREYNFRSGCSA
jgi:hypothetical protein